MSILVVISTFVIGVSFLIWMAYEIWRAPLLDDNYKVIRPTKTLKDLFKYKNKK